MKSVTKILGRVFPVNPNIPKDVLENAKNRGTAVHEWIEKYNNYLVNGGEVPLIALEYQIYADYYKKWIEEYKVVPIHTELKLSADGVVGVIDMICKTKDYDKIVVDFKITYTYDLPYVELQTSAYKHLGVANDVVENNIPTALLHISKSGYSYVKLEDRYDLFEKIKEIDDYIDKRGKK